MANHERRQLGHRQRPSAVDWDPILDLQSLCCRRLPTM